MDRSSVEQLLNEGLSLAQIGGRVGLHEATVGYWVDKHGLRAVNRERHSARGGLVRDELEELVEAGMSIAQIAEAVGRSKATVRHWLGKYGLRTRGPRGARSRDAAREAREGGLSTAMLPCPRHGNSLHVREPRGYFRCKSCRREAVVRRRRRAKETLVAEGGGCCRLCGYDRCVAALAFHHLDPSRKEFGLARRGAHSIEAQRAEVRKCILLCSNCHAEVENGISSLPR
jgi:transposase-like protein